MERQRNPGSRRPNLGCALVLHAPTRYFGGASYCPFPLPTWRDRTVTSDRRPAGSPRQAWIGSATLMFAVLLLPGCGWQKAQRAREAAEAAEVQAQADAER